MTTYFEKKMQAFEKLSFLDKKSVIKDALGQIVAEGEIFHEILTYVDEDTLTELEVKEIYRIILSGVCEIEQEYQQNTIQALELVHTEIKIRKKKEEESREESLLEANLLISNL